MARIVTVDALFTDLSWAAAESDARTSSQISSNKGVHQGTLWGFKLTINATTNNITFTLGIKDQDDDVIYTSGAQADDGIRLVTGLSIPLVEREKVVLTPSGVPGVSTGIVSHVVLYYLPDAIM